MDIFAPAQFVAPDPCSDSKLRVWQNPYNLVVATLAPATCGPAVYAAEPVALDGGSFTLIDVLLALVRAYWYRYSQDAQARSALFAATEAHITASVRPVFTVKGGSDAANALPANVHPCALALLLVRAALMRWSTNNWLTRPPVVHQQPK